MPNKGSKKNPKIFDSIPTIKDAINANMKINITHVLKIFCIFLGNIN